MRICLVNPPLTVNSLHEEWDLSAVDSICPPIGLLLLASVMRQEGHEVSLVDAYAGNMQPQGAADRIIALGADVVGFTATTPSVHGAAAIAGIIKSRNGRINTILGGPHVTAVPEETLRLFPQFDIGVIGEGENAIIEILTHSSSYSEDLGSVQGIVFRRDGALRLTEKRSSLIDMDSLPLPAWDMLPSLTAPYRMSIVGTTSDMSTAIITSRGCPGLCTFCDTSVFGRKFRAYSAGYVINMIEHLKTRYGIEDLLIYDDNFVTDRKRLQCICEMLIKKRYGITWSCCARVNMVTPDMLGLMKKAGCWQIEYGIESGSPEILSIMNKRIELSQVRKALQWTKEAGIMTRGNFIFGYLGETSRTLEETLKFMLSIDLDYFQQTFLTPYPGSAVYTEAKKYGAVDLDWTKLNNLAINFIPNGLSEKELIGFSKRAFKKFYLRPRVIWAHLKRLKSLRQAGRLARAFAAFLKTIFR
jgi:radical SAM superfamily enzyme YgiQ (UPF0313 family)